MTADDERHELMEIIKKEGIVTREVLLSSGKKTSYYYDIKRVAGDPKALMLMSKLMIDEIIMPNFQDVRSVGGLELGSISLSTAIIMTHPHRKRGFLSSFIVRKNPKEHGLEKKIEGKLQEPILIVDDVITSGRSIQYAIDAIRKENFNVEGVVCVLDREEESTQRNEFRKVSLVRAKKIILAVGYHDVYPDIPGFIECWADTIIPCAFCDGYENRDRIWGIVVNSKMELEKLPKMAQNWTSKIKVFISPNMEITPSYQNELSKLGIPIYRGIIKKVNHTNFKVESILLNSGEKIETETLLWIPSKRPSPLIQKLVQNMGVELDQQGYVKTDKMQQTNIKGLYAAGDVQNPFSGALEAAYTGGMSAVSIVHEWYD